MEENNATATDELDPVLVKKFLKYIGYKPMNTTVYDRFISLKQAKQAIIDHQYSDEFCIEHGIDHSINTDMALIVLSDLQPVEAPQKELCGDVISRDAAIRLAEQGQIQGFEWQFKELNKLPPVTPQPKVGQWILLDDCANSGYYCSECQKKVVKEGWSGTVKKIKYCPNCGAKMQDKEVL